MNNNAASVTREGCEAFLNNPLFSDGTSLKRLARAHLQLLDAHDEIIKAADALRDALDADNDYLLDVSLTLEDSDISQLCLIAKAIREIRDKNIVALSQYKAARDSSAKENI